jgi:type III restriction enzyme
MEDDEVLAKAVALLCRHASQHGEKPWSYLLIPHDATDESKTLAGLAASYTFMDH